MTQINRKWDRLSEEDKQFVKNELILFFESERGERIGELAAGELLNFFLETAGTKLYNQGVDAAKRAVKVRFDELNYDLDDLIEV